MNYLREGKKRRQLIYVNKYKIALWKLGKGDA